MSKRLFIFLSLVLILATSVYFTSKTVINFNLNGKTYRLLVADEPEEWERGLMYYKKPVNFDGMIFVFPNKAVRTFWNKNTYLDLEVYWLDGDRVVGKTFLPSIERSGKIVTVSSPRAVDKVVEIIK